VRELYSDDERAAELARMMSGGVTAKAIARAHELLDEARGKSTH
jgi:DNA repair ATPase RecN